MTEDLDTAIGQILAKLDKLGIADNTYVIFTSDNGHQDWNEGREPLRSGKWWVWTAACACRSSCAGRVCRRNRAAQ